ncbi:MAG: hypothetical protein M3Z06_15055 [Actinomycetota bacterium]|nr:hypothetical protein [Actinomycetota bacterium]
MSGSQTSTSARVLRRTVRQRRWRGLSLRQQWQRRKDRDLALAVEIERLERLGDLPRHSGGRARAVESRRWL